MGEIPRACFREEPRDADVAIRLGSKKDLDDGADHGFSLAPGSRIERRLKILAIGTFRHEAIGTM